MAKIIAGIRQDLITVYQGRPRSRDAMTIHDWNPYSTPTNPSKNG